MVEAEVIEPTVHSAVIVETNGFPHSDPIIDKHTTVGEEKKVLLRQNHYNNNVNNVSNDVPPRQQQQRNVPNAIFTNPIKQQYPQVGKRSPSPGMGNWQRPAGGHYWTGHKLPYQPFVSNNVNSYHNYRSDNGQAEQLSKTNLYIRGLPHYTTDDELANMCKRFGTITSTKAITDKQSNKCKGYGFVDFESPSAAQKACAYLATQGTQVSFAKVGKMSMNETMRKQQDSKTKQLSDNIDTTNLYISNLPRNYTESQLDALVSPFGEVVSSRILKDQDGNSKGVGFARLDSKEKCEEAITALNNKPVPGGSEPLVVKFAEAPNPNKKRPMVVIPPWVSPVGSLEEGSVAPMGFMQPVFSDHLMQSNGAAALPHSAGPRPLLIHPSMQMVPIQAYNNLQGGQWMSPQLVPLPIHFPPTHLPVDHHLATQMGQMQLAGAAGYQLGNPYTAYSAQQTPVSEPHSAEEHPTYTIYAPSPQSNGETQWTA